MKQMTFKSYRIRHSLEKHQEASLTAMYQYERTLDDYLAQQRFATEQTGKKYILRFWEPYSMSIRSKR